MENFTGKQIYLYVRGEPARLNRTAAAVPGEPHYNGKAPARIHSMRRHIKKERIMSCGMCRLYMKKHRQHRIAVTGVSESETLRQ